MKSLAQEFTQGCDGLKPHTFTQLKRIGNVCLYARHDPDKPPDTMFGYEVFVVTVNKPNAKFGTPNAEIYPKANAFGKTAYFCTTIDRAMARFEELLAQRPKS
jgi:hypothetical protein